MSEEWRKLFVDGATFQANPHLYDYIHKLAFDSAGAVEMVDGAGQVLITLVKARFSVQEQTPAGCEMRFSDVVEINPYYKSERFRELDFAAYAKAIAEEVPYEERDVRQRLDPFTVHVIREEGLFVLKERIVWRIEDEREWPHRLYRVRYVFSSDPLALFAANRAGVPYYRLEPPDPDTRFYYRVADAQRLTARELAEAGIEFVEDWAERPARGEARDRANGVRDV